jgi:hypothetical protein
MSLKTTHHKQHGFTFTVGPYVGDTPYWRYEICVELDGYVQWLYSDGNRRNATAFARRWIDNNKRESR